MVAVLEIGGSMIRIALVAFLTLILVSIGSANIISLERYTIDTGTYVFYDPSIMHSGPQPAEKLPNGTTYSEYVYYNGSNNEIYIGILEFLEDLNLDSTGSTNVSTPYPGFLNVDNGMISYFGKVSDKVLLLVKTTDYDGAAYLIKNLKVYPKSQENALIESKVAGGLEGT
jgi:hypothetical protein